ncbi:MAG: DNA polymerase III subunit epsilon [Rhizobiaceae bacterium]|nr:DNA polymerase III subunit epsilon [Rhizobiaceae bacterium]
MREIIFDTETTGLSNKDDRIIEFGGVELENKFPTGNFLHIYINPEGKQVHPDALEVHGITDEFLLDKPTFKDIADEMLEFVKGAKLVAHNANFDMGFLNAELARLDKLPIGNEHVIDTLAIARRKHPMGPNSLDALCRRYGIDNSKREKHGALLDAELLAEVYIELSGGKQTALSLVSNSSSTEQSTDVSQETVQIQTRPNPLPPRITDDERKAHAKLVEDLGENAIWAKS